MLAPPASFASLATDSRASQTSQTSPCCVRHTRLGPCGTCIPTCPHGLVTSHAALRRACVMARSKGIDIRLLRGWTNEPGYRARPRIDGPRPMDEERSKTPALASLHPASLAVFGPSSGAGAWPPPRGCGASHPLPQNQQQPLLAWAGTKPRVRIRQTAELGVRSIVLLLLHIACLGIQVWHTLTLPKSQHMVPPPAPESHPRLVPCAPWLPPHLLCATPPPLSSCRYLNLLLFPGSSLRTCVPTHVLDPLILTMPM